MAAAPRLNVKTKTDKTGTESIGLKDNVVTPMYRKRRLKKSCTRYIPKLILDR